MNTEETLEEKKKNNNKNRILYDFLSLFILAVLESGMVIFIAN